MREFRDRYQEVQCIISKLSFKAVFRKDDSERSVRLAKEATREAERIIRMIYDIATDIAHRNERIPSPRC